MATPNESRRDGKGPQQDGRTPTPLPDVDLSLADVLRNIHHQMANHTGGVSTSEIRELFTPQQT
ncbi:hypothetical protein C2S52_021292 [Perilla frutescens var. hirtella]|nr:hypothetical protein C2S52_021292 [Perilla frutescens var. hirtella]